MLSNRLVGIQTCPISSPRINEALAQLKKLLHDPHWPRFLRSLELFTNEEKVMVNVRETDGNRRLAKGFFEWLAKTVEGASDGELYYEAAGFRFRVSHGSFFQVNRHLAGPLVSEALGDAEGRSALDLYAGVGLFSLPLAQRFQQVQAVETDTAAVRDLTVNAEAHGCGIAVQRLQAEQYLEGVTERPDFILADPPRAGLGKHAVRHLLRLRSPRLVLVSCDPSTLARDLAVLLGGGYRLRRLSMVDLFPQTYHIETVAHLIL
jgi:23S rRNA (uracil1939-C5)-methyltransferase